MCSRRLMLPVTQGESCSLNSSIHPITALVVTQTPQARLILRNHTMKEMVALDIPLDDLSIDRRAAEKGISERKMCDNESHHVGEKSSTIKNKFKFYSQNLANSKQGGNTIRSCDLSKLCIINTQSLERIQPNERPYFIDNEFFSGYVFLMVRTPAMPNTSSKVTDDLMKIEEDEKQAKISNHFRDKARRFEFQFQVKLKKTPPGPLYLGAEVENAPKLNMIQRALVNTCLNVVKRLNNGFHFSLGLDERGNLPDEKAIMEGTYEKAHLAFAIESSMDIIIASKPGTTLPKLGEPLFESNESVRHRRSKCRGSVDWNTEDTYTMSFWSCYVDWMLWQVMNFPGVPPFSISDLTSKQPIHLTLYSLEDQKNVGHENQKKTKGNNHRYSNCNAPKCRDISPTLALEGTDSRKIPYSFPSSFRSDSVISLDSKVKDNNDEENDGLIKSDSRSNCISSMHCLTVEAESDYDLLNRCTRNLCFDQPLVASP